MSIKLRLLCTGALGGLANGLFGAGGGLFLVPLFIYWCGLEQRTAFATSVAVIFPLSILSVFLYHQSGAFLLSATIPYCIGGALGGFIAGHIFQKVKLIWLRRAFGMLILYGGIRAVFLL